MCAATFPNATMVALDVAGQIALWTWVSSTGGRANCPLDTGLIPADGQQDRCEFNGLESSLRSGIINFNLSLHKGKTARFQNVGLNKWFENCI